MGDPFSLQAKGPRPGRGRSTGDQVRLHLDHRAVAGAGGFRKAGYQAARVLPAAMEERLGLEGWPLMVLPVGEFRRSPALLARLTGDRKALGVPSARRSKAAGQALCWAEAAGEERSWKDWYPVWSLLP